MDTVDESGLEAALALGDLLREGPAGDALLAATMAQGFSREVARAGLEGELTSWREEALRALLSDVGEQRDRWPRSVLILAARTLPASALRQVMLARALGAEVRLKSASGQEALGEALALADPAVVPVVLSSHDGAEIAAEVARVDTVVVLGSDETVAAIARQVPAGKGFAGHGHKVSAAWVGGEAGPAELEGLARDVLAWDQAGCLAPQVVWCAESPERVAAGLAGAIGALEGAMPLAAGKRAAQAAARRQMVTLAAMLGGVCHETASSVVATHPESTLRIAPGARCVWVLRASLEALRQAEPVLSSVAVVGAGPALGSQVRVCAAGELQRPDLGWRQDGLHPLRSLLRPG